MTKWEQARIHEQAEIIRQIFGVRRFSWLPTKMELGGWVWLRPYWQFTPGFSQRNGEFELLNTIASYEKSRPRNYRCCSSSFVQCDYWWLTDTQDSV